MLQTHSCTELEIMEWEEGGGELIIFTLESKNIVSNTYDRLKTSSDILPSKNCLTQEL